MIWIPISGKSPVRAKDIEDVSIFKAPYCTYRIVGILPNGVTVEDEADCSDYECARGNIEYVAKQFRFVGCVGFTLKEIPHVRYQVMITVNKAALNNIDNNPVRLVFDCDKYEIAKKFVAKLEELIEEDKK